MITTKESPTFGGYTWPGVGKYEKLVGIAFGEVVDYAGNTGEAHAGLRQRRHQCPVEQPGDLD
jgi:hypothetical protein